jgi:hypothetical protein
MRQTAFNNTYYKDDEGRWRYTASGELVPGAVDLGDGTFMAPELLPDRLLGYDGVARVLRIKPSTARTYYLRPPSGAHPLPAPVTTIGGSPVWPEPIIRYWQQTRPGLGWRAGRRATTRKAAADGGR